VDGKRGDEPTVGDGIGQDEFNFTKLENPPAYEPTLCAKCKRRIRLGEDGYSISGDGSFCSGCSPM
jgi:hypothetical protein